LLPVYSAIVVPEQSISEDKGEVTTGRNQTLKELLAHCRHYNPNVRKGQKIFPLSGPGFNLVFLNSRHCCCCCCCCYCYCCYCCCCCCFLFSLDALQGIREIFLRHPQNVLVHLSALFETTFSSIVDDVMAASSCHRCMLGTFNLLLVLYIRMLG